MKKKNTLAVILLFSLLIMLCGCGLRTQQPELPAVSAEVTQVPEQSQDTQSEKPDYFDRVFDTTADAGKLTVRYLYMTEDTIASGGNITTGDASVYTSPEGKIMLVDCSCSASAQQVIDQLLAMDVKKIDILVCSHPHADHIGGFAKVADAFEIDKIYMNDHEYDSNTYRSMMDIISEKNIPCEYLYDGDSFMFGDEVEVKIYNPVKGGNTQIGAGFMDANDYSLAMRLTYKDASLWTSGDLYVSGEQAVIDRYGEAIQSDIMKMNHHGWSTSSLKGFIETLSPLAAVGMHDSITSQTVAMRYSTRDIITFFNCLDGAVRISSDGSRSYDIQSQFVREISFYGSPASDGHYVVSADAPEKAA